MIEDTLSGRSASDGEEPDEIATEFREPTEHLPGWAKVLAETTPLTIDNSVTQLAPWLESWAKSKRVTAATLRDRGCFLLPTYRNVYNEDKTRVIARSYGRQSHMLIFPADAVDGSAAGWQAVKPPRKNQTSPGRQTGPDMDEPAVNVGPDHGGQITLLTESVSTAAALDEAAKAMPEGCFVGRVACCFGATRLPKAADLCLAAFGRALWIVADNDRDKPETSKSHDIGLQQALRAAARTDMQIRVFMPDTPGYDFADCWAQASDGEHLGTLLKDRCSEHQPQPETEDSDRLKDLSAVIWHPNGLPRLLSDPKATDDPHKGQFYIRRDDENIYWQKLQDRSLRSEVRAELSRLDGCHPLSVSNTDITEFINGLRDFCRPEMLIDGTVPYATAATTPYDLATGETIEGVAFLDRLVHVAADGTLTETDLPLLAWMPPGRGVGSRWLLAPDERSTPNMDKVLAHVASDDQETIDYLWAVMGRIITRQSAVQPMNLLIVFGARNTGKSTLAEIINLCVEGNVYSGALTRMDDRFSVGEYVGKNLIVCMEQTMPSTPAGRDAYRAGCAKVKAVTGGDVVTYERKYEQEQHSSRCDAFVLLLGNEQLGLGQFADEAKAFARRGGAIRTPNELPRQDRTMPDKLAAELPAIRRRAVEAFAAAIAASDDPRPKKVVALIEELAVAGMTMTDRWANLRLVKADGASLTPDAAWGDFRAFADLPEDMRPKWRQKLSRSITQFGGIVLHNHRKQVLRWEGVGLAWDGPEPDEGHL